MKEYVMNEQKDTKPTKKPAEAKNGGAPLVHVIRRGSIAASIWQRQTATGHCYYDFSLSRAWKSVSSNRTGYSTNFSEKNEKALVEVVQAASVWIAAQGTEERSDDARESLAA
jgi:hypothetical protein